MTHAEARTTARFVLRTAVERRIEAIKGKKVNISGPAYQLVQAIADRIDNATAPTTRSYNTKRYTELKLVLLEALALIEERDFEKTLK